MTAWRLLAVALAALAALAAPTAGRASEVAARASFFASDDADDTRVVKVSAGLLIGYAGPDRYQGLVAERVAIRPRGGEEWQDVRVFAAFARNGALDWTARVGTDGETLLGEVSAVRNGRIRQEYFVERDRLETPQGVTGDGLYHTFAGTAFDFSLDARDRHQLTLLGGLQDFSDENLRTHLRARYVAVVAPESGLSLQLRSRAFHNSVPREADYYSPEWFVEVMPVAQLRRFRGGWMYAAAAGLGQQRARGARWREARLVEATVASPRRAGGGHFRLNLSYSNTPVGNGISYGYRQLTAEWIRPL